MQSIDGSQKQEYSQWATSFPARFSIQPFNIVNGTVSAVIVGQSGVVQFVTDNPVPISAMNGKTATVTISIRANGKHSSGKEVIFFGFILSLGTDNATIEACQICKPINCPKRCRYGLEKRQGCSICECEDPCNVKNGKVDYFCLFNIVILLVFRRVHVPQITAVLSG